MENSRRGARVLSRRPVGEQRASKVKFPKPFSPVPPHALAGGHRWQYPVPAARSFSRGVLPSLSGKERGGLLQPKVPGNPAQGARPLPPAGAPGWGWGRVVTQLYAPHLDRSAGAREGVPCVLGGTVRISKVKPAGAAPTGKSAWPLPPARHLRPPAGQAAAPGCGRSFFFQGLCPTLVFQRYIKHLAFTFSFSLFLFISVPFLPFLLMRNEVLPPSPS